MIIIKEGTIDKIKNWKEDSIYILADFDRTITSGDSESSWGILSKSGIVPKEYVELRKKLHDYYRPIELNEDMDYETKNKLMIEWWNKHIELLIKYQLSEDVINKVANDIKVMTFRKGAKEFLKSMNEKNIPVIIISAGIGNFIKQFLINNDCNFDNIFIISNFIQYKNSKSIGIKGNIIHSLNKNKINFPEEIKNKITNRSNVVLFGDNISDVKMASKIEKENLLKIGFLDTKIKENKKHFLDNYDIVCTNNIGYDELFYEINKYIN